MSGQRYEISWPGKILFGAGHLAALGDEARALGSHAFLATTRDLSALGLTQRVRGLLEAAGLRVTGYEDVEPDPTCLAVDEAARIARAARADLVVGLGGGSSIDFAKALSVAITHDGPIWEYVTYTGASAKPLRPPILPVIAIPTTAGSGSEVSQGAVLDNPTLGMKAAVLSPALYPRVALVDPDLTSTLPPRTTAMTGFDALTHGIESFLNVERSTPASDLFALEAARRAAENLPRAMANGGDGEARAGMSWAATCGGLAIGLSNASVAHAMALPLGARLHLPHGLALALVQPTVLAHTWETQPDRCAVLADTVGAGTADMTVRERARAFAGWVGEFVERVGLRAMWTGAGADDALAATLAADVSAYMGRPVSQYRPVFSRDEIRSMFEEALEMRETKGA